MSTTIVFSRKQLERHIFDLCRRMGEWKPDPNPDLKPINDAAQRIVDLCEVAKLMVDDPGET